MSEHNCLVAPTFPALLQRFFAERLIGHQNASPRTVAAYRDTFRLLLHYLQAQRRITPSGLTFEHLSADTITGFLQYLGTWPFPEEVDK